MQLVRKYEAGVKKKHGVGKEIFYVEGHWSSVWFLFKFAEVGPWASCDWISINYFGPYKYLSMSVSFRALYFFVSRPDILKLSSCNIAEEC
jgi:hypothetical protein